MGKTRGVEKKGIGALNWTLLLVIGFSAQIRSISVPLIVYGFGVGAFAAADFTGTLCCPSADEIIPAPRQNAIDAAASASVIPHTEATEETFSAEPSVNARITARSFFPALFTSAAVLAVLFFIFTFFPPEICLFQEACA